MGQKIGKYEVIAELGKGAMGVVYKARDPFIGRMVAVKTITTGLQDQPELLQRFYREAQAAGSLAHPNIVTIFDLGESADGTPYIAMEFLEGEDLEHIIADQRPLPVSQKLSYMVQVASALNYAHKRGVVHRDIKPANIVVTKDGVIKVVDFGIARLVDTSRSQTGLLIGTVNYMSPEQVRGERVDGRSDIFSVGVMCYELLAGERPFNGNNFTAVMLAIISQNHKPLKDVMPNCPDDLSECLDKILKKDVAERYQTLEEFLLDVDAPWKRLQKDQVTDMVVQGEQFIAQKDFARARDVLRQAIQIDTSHKHAKTLFEKVNAELKRGTVLPEAQALVKKAEALLKEGKIQEANAEVEKALKLDSVYQPAQDIRVKIQEEANRQQLVKDYLRTTRQRLAEGDITAADQTLKKLLEADSASKEGQELRKQLEDEKNRRQKRQKLLDSMQQARNLWTQQKHEDALKILNGLLKEYPGEAEVIKLQETVQEDFAEQEKQGKLAEAKNLLAQQRFADALGVLEPLTQKYKGDPSVTRLYDHIQAERKVHAQRVRMEKELTALKKLVSEERFADAVAKGEPLLKEFPDEQEFQNVLDYARSQQAQAEKQAKIKAAIKQVEDLVAKGSFAEAATTADKALDTFPGNMDLKSLLDDARAKQKEKEKKEYVEKQIRAIRASIEQGSYTAGIDLARQTLSVVKHDTDVKQLLAYAEKEREGRDAKKQQDQQLQTIVGLAMKQKFDEADKALKTAEKTSIINPLDPRWQELMRAVKEKRTPAEEVVTAKAPDSIPSGTVVAPGQYVYSAGKPVVEPEPTPAGAQASLQQTIVPQQMPVMPPPAPPKVEPAKPAAKPVAPPPPPPVKEEPPKKAKPAVEEPPVKKKEEEKKAKPAVAEPPAPPKKEEKKAAPAVEERPKPRVEEPRPAPRREVAPPPVVEAPKKSPMLMVGVLAGVLVLGVGGYFGYRAMTSGGGGAAGLTAAQQQTMTDADAAFQARDLNKALGLYKQLTGVDAATTKVTEIEGILQKEKDGLAAGQAALKQKQWAEAKAKYNEVAQLNGPSKQQALDAIQTVDKMAQGADPAVLSRDAYRRAQGAFKAQDWGRAISALNEVIGYDQAERPKAERDLQTALSNQKQKEAFDQGMSLLASNRDAAKTKFTEAFNMPGPLKDQAKLQLDGISGAVNKEQQRDALIAQARTEITAGRYPNARGLFPQIHSFGGTTTDLEGLITSGEQAALQGLQGKVSSARAAKNDGELRDLQAQARTMANSQGSQAQAASSLDREIGNYINEIVNDRRAQQEETEWQSAVRLYNGNQKDAAALGGAVKTAFERIAGGGGKYASEARDYVSNKIPALVTSLTASSAPVPTPTTTPTSTAARPCPGFAMVPAGAGGMTQNYKAGDLVPAALLEPKPSWTTCVSPELPPGTTVMLILTVDENGTPVDVKSRGTPAGPNLSAAIAAVKQWKATPPKYKGLGVRTTTALDLKP